MLGGSTITLWSITHGIGAAGQLGPALCLDGPHEQAAGCLAVFEGCLWLGGLSTAGTDPPALWRSDAAGLAWTADDDFTAITAGDPNTSVTALAAARGRLYAATGMPYVGPAPGARVYCRPIAEGSTG